MPWLHFCLRGWGWPESSELDGFGRRLRQDGFARLPQPLFGILKGE